MGWLRGLGRIIGRLVDAVMPMPPDQRAERDWTPMPDGEQSERRKLRLKLHMLEKRGKGGYR